jgi:transglutaminase/protease-like cytokinesis protein 3
MKQLLFFLFLIQFSLQSQNFKKVDAVVAEYPRFSKVENLALKITKDFNTDEEKARAAFFWLTKNIRYNLKEYYNPSKRSYKFRYTTEKEKQQKLQAIKDKLVSNTFLTKTGVCEDYAQSFKKICNLLGLESEVIKGSVRNDSNEIGVLKSNTNHAWNAVKLNNK